MITVYCMAETGQYWEEAKVLWRTGTERILFNTKLTLEQNKPSIFKFSLKIIDANILEQYPRILITETINDKEKPLFDGVIEETYIENDYITLNAKGGLNDFKYSIMDPYELEGALDGIMQHMIWEHNNKNANNNQNIKYDIAMSSVNESNNYVIRSNSSKSLILDELTKKVVNKGGYLITKCSLQKDVTATENGFIYKFHLNKIIHFMEEPSENNPTPLRYGENITKIKIGWNNYNYFNVVALNGHMEDDKPRTIAQVESTNTERMNRGNKAKIIDDDDYNVVSEAVRRAKEELTKSKYETTLEVEGIPYNDDGSLFDYRKKVRVISNLHNVDKFCVIEKMDVDIQNKANNKVSLKEVI